MTDHSEPEHILDKSCWCNPTVIQVTPREDDE